MTLNGVMALILRYFTEFVYSVALKQLLGLPRFRNLFLIVCMTIGLLIRYDLRNHSTIISAKQTVITRSYGREYIDN